MPYQRSLHFSTPLVEWHELALLHAVPRWSEVYRVATPRLMLPLHGAVGCEIAGRRFVCDSAGALWLTPGDDYRLRNPQPAQRSTVLTVAADGAAPFAAVACRASVTPGWHLRLWAWRSAWLSGTVDALAVEEGLAALLATLVPPAAGTRDTAPHRAVESARELLAQAPQLDLRLADIGSRVGCPPFQLARQFRRHTGTSLHAFRTRLRMARAVDRLRQGEGDLTALALELGYSSHSHFSAVFKRCFHQAPAKLRTILVATPRH